jgi:hypothetical protein
LLLLCDLESKFKQMFLLKWRCARRCTACLPLLHGLRHVNYFRPDQANSRRRHCTINITPWRLGPNARQLWFFLILGVWLILN